MGATENEVSWIREARDHQDRRAVPPASATLEQLGIPRRTFCRWYDRYLEGGPEALDLALVASGCASANVHHRPRLLSDNAGHCRVEASQHVQSMA